MNRTELTLKAQELTDAHLTTHAGQIVQEMSLLAQLKEAYSMNAGSGRGSATLKNELGLYSLRASMLHTEIATKAEELWRGRGRRTLGRVSLEEKLKDIAQHTTDVTVTLELFESWAEAIRELYVRREDIFAVCPDCGEYAIEELDDEGTTTYRTALNRVVDKAEANCNACGTRWSGLDAVMDLAREAAPLPTENVLRYKPRTQKCA